MSTRIEYLLLSSINDVHKHNTLYIGVHIWRRCSRRKHLENFHFTSLRILCASDDVRLCIHIYTGVMNILLMSRCIISNHLTHTHTPLKWYAQICANTTIWRQRFLSKTSEKQPERNYVNPDLLKYMEQYLPNRKTSGVKFLHRKWREKLILQWKWESVVVVLKIMKKIDSWTHQ